MKNKKNYLRLISVLGMAIMLLFSGCKKDAEEGQNIMDILSSDSNLSTFVAALQKTGINSVLEDYSPFTVFAPTNAAFDEFFNNLGVSGIDDLSLEYLDSILYYQILFPDFTSSAFSNGYANTLSAGPDLQAIVVLLNATGLTLNGDVNITDFDRMASNGVIHIIDKVLLPPTVFDITIQNGTFSHFVEAVNKAELGSLLSGTGPYTIFAPIDAAFETLFTDLGVTGIADLTKEQLLPILQKHILDGNLRSTDFVAGLVSTHNGDILFEISSSVVINGSSNVIGFDLQGKNGVVHVLDEVLIPGKR